MDTINQVEVKGTIYEIEDTVARKGGARVITWEDYKKLEDKSGVYYIKDVNESGVRVIEAVIMSQILSAGETTLTFTNELFTTGGYLVNIYSEDGVPWESRVLDKDTNIMTLTFEAQSTDLNVVVRFTPYEEV